MKLANSHEETRDMSNRGRLRMRVNSSLTGAAVELISKSTHGDPKVVTVRLLEAAAGYRAGTTLHVGVDEFVADDSATN